MINPVFYDKICVMLPTYGRAATKLPKFLKSMMETAHDLSNVCVSFVVNERDTDTVAAIGCLCGPLLEYEILYEQTIECDLAHYFNLAYDKTQFNDPSTCVSMFGDDMVFVTTGWDRLMLDKMNDKMGFGIVYGDDDLCQHDALAVYFVTSRMYVELTGKPFMHPGFGADWIDVIHTRAAKELGALWYIPALHIRHEHFTASTGASDETTLRNRVVAVRANEKKAEVDPYVAEMVASVRAGLAESVPPELAFVMTTYDRVPILERMARTWNKAVWSPPLTVFDDGSVRAEEVRRIVGKMRGATLVEGSHVGCDGNNIRALRAAVERSGVEAVMVLDSDTIFSEAWLFAAVLLWRRLQVREGTYCGASVFNTIGHAAEYECCPQTVAKRSVGGFGAIYPRGIIYGVSQGSLDTSWDNDINSLAFREERLFLVTRRSYIQHGGYCSGLHANDLRMADYGEAFAGESEPIREIAVGRKRGPVLFAAMARLGDVIGASMVANMLIERGVDLTWMVIPMYVRLVERICPGVKVLISEPVAGGPQGDWSETNTYEMRQRYPQFEAHINAQVGARENHDEYMRSGMSPCEFVRMVCCDVTGIDLGTDYQRYLRFDGSGIHYGDHREPFPENLAIICPQAKTSPVFTDEMVERIFSDLQREGYSPRILVPDPPQNLTAREIRNRYIYRQTIEQCIMIIKQARMFVGGDSGMSWCALYSGCKKRIYHNAERLRKVNTYFSKLDVNAEDIAL